jgi:hypothetical protein
LFEAVIYVHDELDGHIIILNREFIPWKLLENSRKDQVKNLEDPSCMECTNYHGRRCFNEKMDRIISDIGRTLIYHEDCDFFGKFHQITMSNKTQFEDCCEIAEKGFSADMGRVIRFQDQISPETNILFLDTLMKG